MEKNTTNYKFLNAKDRAAERKRSSSVMETDRYHYKTVPHVQTGKRKRDNDGFFTPYAMFRPYSGTGLLCAILGKRLPVRPLICELHRICWQRKPMSMKSNCSCVRQKLRASVSQAFLCGRPCGGMLCESSGGRKTPGCTEADGGGYQTDDSGCGYLAFRLDSAE